ncbi:LacI family transcriptional regulator [Cellulomonas bogoriensis 69B4 = DSM 16987]|uniref:LacI family transcriptional regulator n=2 Tax=Cellulomonas bogoriensis TaxID=301388 RepID=A0A0A0BPL6_9CELL|nr:LacI family transcriptional regulator [Cellulomonas bogoriensis 69B4 = DSM 16987]
MSDVAALAGVSHQTVSRVLNGHLSVRPETRERVLQAIADLGYRRNSAARALVTRRTGTVGVVTSTGSLFGPSSSLLAVEEAARDAGYFVSVASVAHWERAALDRALDHFLSQGVEGVIVMADHDRAIEAVVGFDTAVPVIMLGPAATAHPDLMVIGVDQQLGGRLATRHLLDLGHTQVLHVSGPADWPGARARVEGWRTELQAAGLDPGDPLPGDWSPDRGYEVGTTLVREGLPSAVFTTNDHMALGLLRAFAEAGVRVPQDVSVVGFDDIHGSDHFHPPLTTVRQDFRTLGQRCMAALLAAIAEDEDVLLDPVEPLLVVRASSGPPRQGR